MSNEEKQKDQSCDQNSCKQDVMGGLFYLLAQEEEKARKEKEKK